MTKEMAEMAEMADEPEAAGQPGPQEITCSGGVKLPLLNALRERPQIEEDSDNGE